jgi:hypothetical protein
LLRELEGLAERLLAGRHAEPGMLESVLRDLDRLGLVERSDPDDLERAGKRRALGEEPRQPGRRGLGDERDLAGFDRGSRASRSPCGLRLCWPA